MTVYVFFFFKQKTAYEMRMSDWSSDVSSSDLFPENPAGRGEKTSACCSDGALPYLMSRQRMNRPGACRQRQCTGKGDACLGRLPARAARAVPCPAGTSRDRKSVGSGKMVTVRVDLGGRRILKKTTKTTSIN